MTDVFSTEKRSSVMSRIRGKGNKDTELRLIEIFRANGVKGWRRNAKLFGNPDFVLRSRKLVIFVDGCFWHCCPEHGTMPANNREFWANKLARNVARDRLVNNTLQSQGWSVLRIWEHELKKKNAATLVHNLKLAINSNIQIEDD